MAETFETARLILRPFRMDDLRDIYEQVYSDPDVCRYYCGATRTKTKTKAWLAYRVTEAVFSDFYAWAAELKETKRVTGLVRLGPYVNHFERIAEDVDLQFNPIDVELSFAFGRGYWGQGLALEACRRIIEHAFQVLQIPRLVNGIRKENSRSVRFHEKLGYRVTSNLLDGDYVGLLANPGVAVADQNDPLT